jgi:hypothetical protein
MYIYHQLNIAQILTAPWIKSNKFRKAIFIRAGPRGCGRSPAEIVVSSPTGGMDVCLLWVLCVVRQRSLRRADHSSRGVLPTVMCLSVLSRNLVNEEALAHWGLSRQKQTNKLFIRRTGANLNKTSAKCGFINGHPIWRLSLYAQKTLRIISVFLSPSSSTINVFWVFPQNTFPWVGLPCFLAMVDFPERRSMFDFRHLVSRCLLFATENVNNFPRVFVTKYLCFKFLYFCWIHRYEAW